MELKINDDLDKDCIVSICQVLKSMGITQYQSLDYGFMIIHKGELYRLLLKEEENEKKTS